MNIRIYTDGSCLGNPGPGGFCAIVGIGDQGSGMSGKTFIIKGGDRQTTNNRMEISAVIAGLYWAKKKLKEKSCAVYSDSTLVISTLTKHWKRKKNLDLWEKLDLLLPYFTKIEWHWVRGHNGHPGNEKADKIALKEAKKQQKGLISKKAAI